VFALGSSDGEEFTGFPPLSEAKPATPASNSGGKRNSVKFRFETAHSPIPKEYEGLRIRIGNLSNVWYEVHSLENFSLPQSKHILLPDPPYIVHLHNQQEIVALWIMYIPRLVDTLDDWTPNQVIDGQDEVTGKPGKIGFGVLSTLTLIGASTEPPMFDSLNGQGCRLVEDIPPQVAVGYDATGNPFSKVTRWIVLAQPTS